MSKQLACHPPLTVLMSVYNGASFLREAVDSVLSQTMANFEFLIIDDGSTDETPGILASYCDSRIRMVRQENQGLAAALNHGLALARTDLVARMDADDVSLPHRLELQLTQYQRLGCPDVMGTAIELISETGHAAGIRGYPEDHATIARNLLHGGPTLAHPTVLYRRHAVLMYGGYDPTLKSTEDYDLWLRMLAASRFANLPECTLRYRIRAGSMERSNHKAVLSSPAFLHCLVKQRYLLVQAGYKTLWEDEEIRQCIIAELAHRFQRAGIETPSAVGRTLQVARVECLSPRLRARGAGRALRCLLAHPIATLRYAASHYVPEPAYLTAAEVLGWH